MSKLDENYRLVKAIIRKHCGHLVDWNDLADTNSIYDYIQDTEMTEEQLNTAARDAMADRLAEDDAAQMANITIEDVWTET